MKHSLPGIAVSTAAALALSGCAAMQASAPKYDPTQSAAAQAAAFVHTEQLAKVDLKKVAITSCNVIISQATGGTSGTQAGAFQNDSGRVDKSISQVYTLRGISVEQQAALSEQLCQRAEDGFKKAGFNVVTMGELASNEDYKKMHEAGSPSPVESGHGAIKNLVFAPKGQAVVDPKYQGAGKGLKMAFSGANPAKYEAGLAEALDATAAHVEITIDFAKVAGDGKAGFLSSFQKKDAAQVKAEVGLSMRGRIFFAGAGKKRWNPMPKIGLKAPLMDNGELALDIKDETTTGDKAANAFSTAVGILTAVGGGNGRSFSVSRKSVTVTPDNFTSVAKKMYGNIIDMQMTVAKGG